MNARDGWDGMGWAEMDRDGRRGEEDGIGSSHSRAPALLLWTLPSRRRRSNGRKMPPARQARSRDDALRSVGHRSSPTP